MNYFPCFYYRKILSACQQLQKTHLNFKLLLNFYAKMSIKFPLHFCVRLIIKHSCIMHICCMLQVGRFKTSVKMEQWGYWCKSSFSWWIELCPNIYKRISRSKEPNLEKKNSISNTCTMLINAMYSKTISKH